MEFFYILDGKCPFHSLVLVESQHNTYMATCLVSRWLCDWIFLLSIRFEL